MGERTKLCDRRALYVVVPFLALRTPIQTAVTRRFEGGSGRFEAFHCTVWHAERDMKMNYTEISLILLLQF